MAPDHDDEPRLRIGPGYDPADAVGQARERLRREQAERRVSRRLITRLIVAFVLVVVIAVLVFVIAPRYGVVVPPIVPIVAFVAITIGAILTAPAEKQIEGEDGESPRF